MPEPRKTVKEIKEFLLTNEIPIIWDDEREYVNAFFQHKWKCLKCDSNFEARWNNIQTKRGCPYCRKSPQKINETNSLFVTDNWMVDFLKNKEDANIYASQSSKKIEMICPTCGFEKNMRIHVLRNCGFACPYCSDGMSLPEKFGMFLFKNLKINFEYQKTFEWSLGKRYDFFIENFSMLIEVHGLQHYRESKGVFGSGVKSLEEEQNNDSIKKDLAVLNGIKNYIIIDCRFSTFPFISENYKNQLQYFFNFELIDLTKIWEECQKSLIVRVWELWNNREEGEVTSDIAKIFGIDRQTIVTYLKAGNACGRCIYIPEEQRRFSIRKAIESIKKPVLQCDLEGNVIKLFNSVSEARKETGAWQICEVCKGARKTSKGFIWKYKENNEEKIG